MHLSLSTVKSLLHSVISLLLIGALVLLGISPEVFHEHEEHTLHCDEHHENNSVDECHIRLFHDGGSLHCTDHQHLVEGHEECSICQLQTPKIQQLKFVDESNYPIQNTQILIGAELPGSLAYHFTSDLNTRGPPSPV